MIEGKVGSDRVAVFYVIFYVNFEIHIKAQIHTNHVFSTFPRENNKQHTLCEFGPLCDFQNSHIKLLKKTALNSKRLGQFNNTNLIASPCTIEKPDVRESS